MPGGKRVLQRVTLWTLILQLYLMTPSGLLCGHDRRPNIVFILADDLGWGEIGCFGQTRIATPHLDRMAREGTRLTRHYSGAPVCAPSRCVLLTGLHTGHAEIRGNLAASKLLPQFDEGQYPLSESATTWFQEMQKVGYVVGAFGKWGLGPVTSSGDPLRHGVTEFFGYNCQSLAHSYYPAYLWHNDRKIPLNQNPVPGHARQPSGDVRMEDWIGEHYAPDVMLTEALTFLRRHADRPFVLYLPLIQPHLALHPPRQRVEKFPLEWDTVVYRGENGYLPHPRPRAAYAALITEVDEAVGRVFETLHELKLTDRTLVIFSSDNGTTHPRPANPHFHVGGVDATFFRSTAGLRGYKGDVYEGGVRVPTIVWWRGVIRANHVVDTPSYFADWYPTLCEAVGIPYPASLDGVSMWRLLTCNEPVDRVKPMIWVFPEYGGQVAVNWGRWKVLRRNLKARSPGPWEVYDLEADPSEAHNLVSQKGDLVALTRELLSREMSDNPIFPLELPEP